jgi:hypothetical protein
MTHRVCDVPLSSTKAGGGPHRFEFAGSVQGTQGSMRLPSDVYAREPAAMAAVVNQGNPALYTRSRRLITRPKGPASEHLSPIRAAVQPSVRGCDAVPVGPLDAEDDLA